MGSGKTTVGKKLAQRLGYHFIDMDREIEKKEQKKIAEIFSELGEAHFRNLETQWLENFSLNNTIISTGGGTPCFNDNMKRMNELGTTVYLNMSASALAHRLFQANQDRPLLKNYMEDKDSLSNFIALKLNVRNTFYQQAKLTIDGTNLGASELDELIGKLSI